MDEINVSNSTFGQRQRNRLLRENRNVGNTLSWTLSAAVRSLSLITDKRHCKLSHQARYFPPGGSLHENHKRRLSSKQVGICHTGLTSPSLYRGFNTENPTYTLNTNHRMSHYASASASSLNKSTGLTHTDSSGHSSLIKMWESVELTVANTTFLCSS